MGLVGSFGEHAEAEEGEHEHLVRSLRIWRERGCVGKPDSSYAGHAQKGAHTHTHFPPLPPPTTGTLHTAFGANGKGRSCPTPITRANREMLTSAVFWCVQLKEAHRHVHRGLARWID